MPRVLSSGGDVQVTEMWRRADDNTFYKDMPDRNAYIAPIDDVKYKLRISGISEVFQMKKGAQFAAFEGEMQDKIRLEYEILDADDRLGKAQKGKRFSQLINYPKVIGDTSNLGKLFGAIRGKPFGRGEETDLDHWIGVVFAGRVLMDGNYPKITVETIRASNTILTPELGGQSDDDDPFALDEDEDVA